MFSSLDIYALVLFIGIGRIKIEFKLLKQLIHSIQLKRPDILSLRGKGFI